MDAVAGLLDGPRARGAFLLRSTLAPPWSMRIADEAPLTFLAVVRGEAVVLPDEGDELRLGSGDACLLRGPAAYTVADDPATAPQVLVLPGQRCVTPEGREVVMRTHGVRTWGNSRHGETELLTGTYQLDGEVGRRLLRALPPVAVIGADALESPLIALLAEEIVRDAPGQEAVLDRLLDLLLLTTLREWFARPEADPPAWYRALGDPVVGHALRLLHDRPADRWSVASLAAEAGVSRATLARRFADLVGEPPMAYLTSWRLSLAADLLARTDDTVESIARQVGYESGFGLSVAFKRVHGTRPSDHRAALAG